LACAMSELVISMPSTCRDDRRSLQG
jgi:hypothetical protein